ncbi:hypothetical protein C5167_029768 [Papaver somniferum]|nr:hypothetical protein C5167_029768 [Papaver somniferum]
MMDLLRMQVIHGGAVKSSVDSTWQKWEVIEAAEWCSKWMLLLKLNGGCRNYLHVIFPCTEGQCLVVEKASSKKISLKSVMMLADQMVNRVEFVLAKSFLHRDIKPDNLLMGLRRRANQVYVVGFGLAKMYRDITTHSI